jgi:hypothetical protein
MGANRSKILSEVKTNTKHNLENVNLDDLLDDNVLDAEFPRKIFKEFIREDIIDEEEESHLLRNLELYKRDMLVNFTSAELGKDIPNMSNNYGKNILN